MDYFKMEMASRALPMLSEATLTQSCMYTFKYGWPRRELNPQPLVLQVLCSIDLVTQESLDLS